MQELNNKLLAATDSLEIIEISDKILNERLRRYLKHTFLKGESLLSLGKFDEALSVFEQILKYDDDRFTGRAHNSIGFCYSMKNKPRKAESEFKKARKYCDESTLLLNSATLNIATYYSMTKQKEDVYKIFKELYVMDPSNRFGDSYMLVLMSSNNPQEFIETYDLNIDESFPKDEQIMARKAIALMDLERFEEAIPILEDALKYTDDKEGLKIIHFHLGVSYFRLGELDKVIYEFEKAREYNDDSSLLLQIAKCYEMANQKEKALDVLKEYSELVPDNQDIKKKIENLRESDEPDSDEIYNNKCLTLINLNRFDEAIECYDKALKINPNNVKAWNNKAFALHNLNRLEEAIECYDKTLEIDPNFISALNNKAFALRTLNRLDEAIECYDKVLKITPNDFNVLNNKAFSLHELNRSDEAIECYDKALKINPNDFKLWANKGFTLENLDRLDDAVECYNKALAIFPNNPDILNRLSFIKAQKNGSEILDLYL
ncbi:MAG: tetratricopeptide repeat protein [Methanobrevibacter sp.]|nr:tetratricopeptide repeat protein [Methanobrevibacter sp.]